jgi:hypothetical protein
MMSAYAIEGASTANTTPFGIMPALCILAIRTAA